MAIKDATTEIQHAVEDVNANVDSANSKIQQSMQASGNALSYGLDFAGMDEANISKFHDALATYQVRVNAILSGLNAQKGPIEEAFKGEGLTNSIQTFFTNAKTLLTAYVKTIEVEEKLVIEANENWKKASGSLSTDITEDANTLRAAAEGLVVEE